MKRPYQNNVYLTGFMGSGKSTVGPIVAEKLGRRFLDTDLLVEQMSGLKIPDIFEHKGEAAFRSWESQIVEQLVAQKEIVVALGGGALLAPANAELVLDTGHLIYLRTGVETLVERLEVGHRPLLRSLEGPALVRRVHEMLAEREPVYKLAPLQVDTDGKTPFEVAQAVLERVSG